MKMKSVKLDEEAYEVAQEGKAAGGFSSLSAFLKHVFNLAGLSTFDAVNETQERRENRQKLAEIHALCQEIRDLVTPTQGELVYRDMEIKSLSESLRAIVAVDQNRLRDFK